VQGTLAHPKYRADIDGLRAIAVLAVVGFHAFPEWFKAGFLGVDVFFVISGFLISTIILENLTRQTFTFSSFYSRRVRRIFPALLIVMGCCWAFGWFALFADEFERLGTHILFGAGFASNFAFWMEAGYFDPSASTKPLLHLWSLGIEEQFYLVWPPILLLSWKWRKTFPVIAVLSAISLVSYIGLPYTRELVLPLGGQGMQLDLSRIFYSPVGRFWELSIGGMLAYYTLFNVPRRRPWFPSGNVSAAVGLVLLAGGLLLFETPKDRIGWLSLAPVPGTFLLIAAGSESWINRKILSQPALVWFGLISYPLYLWHWPLFSFLEITEDGAVSNLTRGIAALLAIALAWGTYRIVEKPFRIGAYGGWKVATLGVLMFFTALLGYGTHVYRGFENRSAVISNHTKALLAREVPAKPTVCAKHPEIPSCKLLSNDGAPTVAIIGDSHATQLFPGLDAYYGQRHENLLSMESCMILKGVDSIQDGDSQSGCRKDGDAILDYLIRSSSIKTVILSFRGPLSVEGTGYWPSGPWTDQEPKVRKLSIAARPELSDNSKVFAEGLRSTLSMLVEAHKQVIFVFDNPELGFNPSSCEPRPLSVLGTRPKSPCGVERKAFETRNAAYIAVVKSVLQDFPSVQTFSSTPVLCDKDYCYAEKDGVLLYEDDEHLSYAASLLVGRSFAPSETR
jgi:peptidoglycan/LPS O-acetylase OafA/YrhL